ncbi:MAG: ABC transporter permease subunit [Candidatus Thorarchaeota archaeon]
MATQTYVKEEEKKLDRWREVKYSIRMLRRNALFIVGAVLIFIFIFLAVTAQLIAPYPKDALNTNLVRAPPLTPDNKVVENWYSEVILNSSVTTPLNNPVSQIIDIDNDGKLDLAVGTGNGNIIVYKDFYVSTTEFQMNTPDTLKYANGTVINVGVDAAVTFADINNDGKQEMMVGNEQGKIFLFEQTGAIDSQGLPFWTGSLMPELNVGSYAYPVFLDYDANNITDLIIGGGNGTLNFYQNIGTASNANFTLNQSPYEHIIWLNGSNPLIGQRLAVSVGNLDISDNKPDLAISTQTNGTVFLTNAHKFFTSPISYVEISATDKSLKLPPISAENFYTGLNFLDFNNDTSEDMIAGTTNGTLTFFYRTLTKDFPMHFFGTDDLGRDIFSRCLIALQIDLIYSIWIVFVAMIIGCVLGALAGYFGGIIDTIIMRFTDIMFSFPGIILAIAIASVLGRDFFNLSLALIAVWWTGYTRLVRGQILVEKERPYVEAATALGYSNTRILFRHILPNAWYPLLVNVTLDLGAVILSFAGLSFIGFGAGPGEAELGRMISDGRQFFLASPWLTFFPGLFIFIIVMGWNLVGDGLRDILDPQLRR